MRPGLHPRAGLVVLGAALLAATSGCSGDSPQHGAGKGAQVRVTERDFHIAAPRTVAAGEIRFSVRNKGPDNHEFIVVREARSQPPLRPDGLTVDEDAVEKATPGALEPQPPGVSVLRVRLSPGRYKLLCNMAGHYMGGMHTTLVVRS
jgi:uncharacterized cupredoxin-like copper-binding protein